MGGVLSRVYYAMQDTFTVAKVGGVGALLNLALALILAPHLDVLGPALAYSVAATVNFFLLLVLLHKRLRMSLQRDEILGAARIMAASVIAALGMHFTMAGFSASNNLGGFSLALYLIAMATVCLLVYVGGLCLFRVRELRLLASWLRGKDVEM
jgi:putative peptidoglycan lipid II flippase